MMTWAFYHVNTNLYLINILSLFGGKSCNILPENVLLKINVTFIFLYFICDQDDGFVD